MFKKIGFYVLAVLVMIGIVYAQTEFPAIIVVPNANSPYTFMVKTANHAADAFRVDTENNTVYIGDDLYVVDDSDLRGDLIVYGSTSLETDVGIGTTLTVTGNSTFTGTLTADSTFILNDQAVITGDVTIVSNSIVAGSGMWAGCPSQASPDPSVAWFYMEDFAPAMLDSAGGVSVPDTTAAFVGTNATLRGWKHFGTAGWTMTQAAGGLNGDLLLTTLTGSDNEYFEQMGELGTETYVEITESSGNNLYFEVSVAEADTSAVGSFFVGLAEEGSAQTDFIADAGNDFADLDILVFVSWEGAPDTVHVAFQTSGGAFVDTFGTKIGEGLTRYGFKFDGDSTINFYINGTSVGTVEQDIALFPDTEELSPIFGVKEGSGDRVLTFDYIKIVQER